MSVYANQNKHNLEFELRLQQYIEMVRTQDKSKKVEAIIHAKKYLVSNQQSQNTEIMRAAGLLVFTQDTRAEPYKVRFALNNISWMETNKTAVSFFIGSLELSFKSLC